MDDVLVSCEEGRECVIRIRELMLMIMRSLRSLNPNDTRRKDVLLESLTNIKNEFQYLRIFYNICEADAPKFTDVEGLVPSADEMLMKEPKGEAYAKACKERDAVREEVALKNQQLAEVIKHMRKTIYIINCMLARANTNEEEKTEEKPKKKKA